MPGYERPPDVALIGAGYWGRNVARNLRDLGVLKVICDSSRDVLAQYRADVEYTSIATVAQVRKVLEDQGVSKVVIATPAATHFELVKAALLASKDVLVEKPLCLSVGDAEAVVEVAERRERVLMVGHLLQYHPCIERLQLLVDGGDLGKLQYMISNRLNLGKIRREENALWNFAPHDLSVVLSLAGLMPDQTRCTGGTYLSEGIADTTLTSLRFPGGVRAHVYVSWLNPFKEQKLTVVGSHGMVVFDDTKPWGDKLVFYRQPLTWKSGQTPTPNRQLGEPVAVCEAEPLRQECVHFLACCEHRTKPKTDGAEGVRVLRVLAAAQRSLDRDGEAVACCPAPQGTGTLDFFVHPSAVVDEGAAIGVGTKVWHFSHIASNARIGHHCILGQNTMVGGGVTIGDRVKIQNNVSVYSGVTLEDDVFLGPSCVLTNVSNPRAQIDRHSLYEKTLIRRGATIGANATILPGVTLGRYCFVSAGAVVTRDVPDYAWVRGVPARQVGWFSRHGHPLAPGDEDGAWVCPESGLGYREVNGRLVCATLDENDDLPEVMKVGAVGYQQLKLGPRARWTT